MSMQGKIDSLSKRHGWRPAVLAGLLGLFSATALAETLNFQQCVEAALGNNPELMMTRARVDQADSALRGSEGARLPRVNLSLTATRTDDPLNAFGLKLEQQTVDPARDFSAKALNQPDAINNFNTRIEVQAPLYTGGLLTARMDQARALARAARDGDAAARQTLIRQLAEAYQGVHTARAYIKVAEQARSAAQEFVRVTESLHRQGMAVKSDLLAARVNLEDARIRLIEARRKEATALDQLKLLMGRSLWDSLEVGGPLTANLPDGKEENWLERARQEHPALQALRGQVDAGRAEVDAARAAYRPRVDVVARQDWNSDTPGFDARSYTLVGVLSWNAFDGGTSRANVGRAQAARTEAEARLRQAEDGIAFGLREAHRLAREAEEVLAARQAAVEEAEEAQRLTRKRYENGLTTLMDLLAVQTQLDKARADQVAAAHALTVNRMELKRAMGLLTPENL